VGVRRSSVPSRGSRSGQRKRSLSGEQAENWRQGSEAARRLAVSMSGVMVASYVRERERIFLRWLENVERMLSQPVDGDAAYKAWQEGYSVREYAR
jgi:hypothetical protein